MLVVPQPPAVLEDLVRRRRHQQRLVQGLAQLERQPQVPLHVLQRVLAVLEPVVYYRLGAVYQIGAVDVGDREDLQHVGQRHPGAVGEGETLGQTRQGDAVYDL